MFVMSENTRAMVKALRSINRDVSYETLSKVVGFPVTGATPSLTSARRHLHSAENILFDVVRGQGLRRLDDGEKVSFMAKPAKQIHRASKRGTKVYKSIDNFAALSLPLQLEATLRATQFEFAAMAVSTKKLPGVEPVDNTDLNAQLAAIKALGKKK